MSDTDITTAVQLDVWHDLACPWCFIGARNLRTALETWPGEVSVRYRAFQLQPDMPEAGLPAGPFFAAKFGSAEATERSFARVAEAGEAAGIRFALNDMLRAPNTALAHRVVALARTRDRTDEVVEAIFRALFEQGRDISDRETLLALAEEAGVPAGPLAEQLERGGALVEVTTDLQEAARLGVSGVPLFVVAGRGLSGAHPPEIIIRFLDVVTAGVATGA